MIYILKPNLERDFIVKDTTSANRFEELNGENTLSFEAVLESRISGHLTENSILECNNDYFDIAFLGKEHGEDGVQSVTVEGEHVSYRLNDPKYDLEIFAETGTPQVIFQKLLVGTGFTIGVIESTTIMTYSVNEETSRRQLLVGFANLLGFEMVFNKFQISLVVKRGSRDIQLYTTGKNVSVLSSSIDKRDMEDNKPKKSYTCQSITLPNAMIGLGDDILLVQKELGVRETLRVVSYSYDPYSPYSTKLQIADFIQDLQDEAYRIEESTVSKGRVYNGCSIGPNDGFVAEGRVEGSDEILSKTIMNATEGISIYSDSGEGLTRNFYVDLDGRIKGKGLDISGDATFEGAITGGTITLGDNGAFKVFSDGSMDIGRGNFMVDRLGSMVAYNAYFEGEIAGATNITVTTDVSVGNWLNIGSITSSGGTKGINIYHGGNYARLDVDSGGDMTLLSWRDLDIVGSTIYLLGDVILPYWSYLDYKEEEYRLATQGDLTYIDDELVDVWDELDYLYGMISDL